VRRREFITLVGGATAWPMVARAQQGERVRRIGVLLTVAANDPEAQIRITAFQRGLQELGWTEGRNVRTEYRFAAGDADRTRSHAADLVGQAPDVILANGTAILWALQRETRSIPIVFVGVPDPVGDGFVTSLAHPDGNLTGFTNFEFSMGGKWLQLLTEIMPNLERAALIFNPDTAPGRGLLFLRSVEAARPSLATAVIASPAREVGELERVIARFAGEPNAGLIIHPDLFTAGHQELIVALAARHRLPAVYPFSYFVDKGGLISYGTATDDLFRRSASYIDRILRGAKPADLPVQQPIKFELFINLQTAKTLGLKIPAALVSRADKVIE
jgi:putative tryptophan/tyrosine transport system substrate-binding protein